MHPSLRGAFQAFPSADTDIAMMASSAALALDKRIRKEGASLEPVHRFTDLLSERLGLEQDKQRAKRALLDPISTDFFRRAFLGSDLEFHSTGDLRDLADDLIKRLRASDGTEEKEELQKLRDLCVALSRSAQAALERRRREEPEHEYRR